mmetsp:Transcript_16005/g.44308  ORF Transcript_16005/g.44308 Transcript_16005/m.44308 type:complete len:128 (-) Transcript_16005:760-1143(-)
MIFDHAAAFSIARRDSEKNEPDFLQENFCDDTTAVSESYCSSLLHSERGRLVTDKPLPDECRQFASIRDALHQHSTTSGASDIAFAGMHAGEAQIAQAARAHGNLAPAQIKRRLTNRSKKTESSWFH